MADLDFTINANTGQAQVNIKRLEATLKSLTSASSGIQNSLNQLNSKFDASNRALNGIGESSKKSAANLGTLATSVKGFIGALAISEVVQFGQTILNSAKQFEQYRNQLKLVTESQADLERLLGRLSGVARENRTSVAATIDLYTKLRISTEDLGLSEERVIGVTTKLSQALAVAGADAATTNSVIRQFGQAMASGVVRGDEFNSLVEGLGPALAIMARESGITVGRLREMAGAGELTAEKMVQLLENTRSLTLAFQEQSTTTQQLETALSDAFDRMLAEIAEVSGATKIYRGIVEDLTRSFDRIAGADVISNKRTADIFVEVEQGVLSATEAIKEYEKRLKDLRATALADQSGLGALRESREAPVIKNYIELLRQKAEEEKKNVDQARADLKALEEQQKAYQAAVKPFQAYIKEAEKFTKLNYGDQLQQANERLNRAREVINNLEQAYTATNGKLENYNELMRAAQNEVAAATGKINELKDSGFGLQGFDKFYFDLVKGARASAEEIEFTKQAQQRLNDDLAAGTITLEAYTEAMKNLNKELQTRNDLEEFAASVQKDNARELQRIYDDIAKLGMSEIEQKYYDIAAAARESARAAIDSENARRAAAGVAPLSEEEVRRYYEVAEEGVGRLQQAQRQHYEQSRTWATGWKKAFKEYQEAATNAAQRAERIFRTTTKGLEDMIVNFVKTGKFEWKDFVATILEDLLRGQLQGLISQGMGALGELFGIDLGGLGGGAGGSAASRGASASNPLYVLPVGGGLGGGGGFSFGGTGGGMGVGGVGGIGGGTGGGRGTGSQIGGLVDQIFGTNWGSQVGGIFDRITNPRLDDLIPGGGYGGAIGQGVGTGGIGGRTGGLLGGGAGRVNTEGTQIGNVIKQIGDITRNAGKIWDTVSNVGGKVWDVAKNVGSGIWDVAKNVGGSLWSGISSVASSIGSFFGGFFADGGSLAPGKWGIVGERGPEIITGPANITPMDQLGGNTTVVYNINAVDALSFKQLVARDPAFIHSIAMQGGRGIPARR